MRIAVIVNCTSTQSVRPPAFLHGASLPAGLNMVQAVEEWVTRLSRAAPEIGVTPAELYRGLAFHTVSKIAELVGRENVFVASIGQGLVNLQQKITPYDLSIDPTHPHSLTHSVNQEPFVSTLWWSLINKHTGRSENGKPICDLVCGGKYDAVVIACTMRFLGMQAEDILNSILTASSCRILIAASSTIGFPGKLRSVAVWYDKRLGASTIGNRNDLNVRAGLNLVKTLLDLNRSDLESVQESVTGGFKNVPVPQRGSHSPMGLLPTISSNPSNALALIPKFSVNNFGAEHMEAAKAAMGGLTFASGLGPKRFTLEEEYQAAGLIVLFVSVLKEINPHGVFTSSEVVLWAHKYCGAVNQSVPEALLTSKTAGRIIRRYGASLGISTHGVGQSGVRRYTIDQGVSAGAEGGEALDWNKVGPGVEIHAEYTETDDHE